MKKLEITSTAKISADLSEREIEKIFRYCQYALTGSETAIMLEKESDIMAIIRYNDKIRSCPAHLKIKRNILLEITGNSGILMYPEETKRDIYLLTKAMDQIIIPPEEKVYNTIVNMTIPVSVNTEDEITFAEDNF